MDFGHLKAQIKSHPDNEILKVVSEHITLTPVPPTFRASCPFHGGTDLSFDVDHRRQRYRCWSCNQYGDVIAFVQSYRKLSFQDAVEWLATRAGIAMPTASTPMPCAAVGPNVATLPETHKAAILLRTCMNMSDDGVPIDLITLSNRMHEQGVLDKVGGPKWLADLWDVSRYG